MAKGKANGDMVQHFSTIRVRATGQGNLRMMVRSLDDVRRKFLVPLPLEAANRIIPNRIVNFVEQKACFEFSTTELNEYVRVNRITVFMKDIYTSTPGA